MIPPLACHVLHVERKLPGMKFRQLGAADYAAAALWWRSSPVELDEARPAAPGRQSPGGFPAGGRGRPFGLLDAVYENTGQAPSPGSPWHRTDGWRLGDHAPWRVVCAGPGRTDRVTVSGDVAGGGTDGHGVVHVMAGAEGSEHTAQLTGTQRGVLALEWDGEPRRYTVARAGNTVILGSGGWTARVPVLTGEEATARMLAGIEHEDAAAEPEVRSPMPGTVTVVNVKTGDTVSAGTVLLAVEAMKMEHQLTAAMAGIVHLSITAGSLVKADQVVATIQAFEGEPHA